MENGKNASTGKVYKYITTQELDITENDTLSLTLDKEVILDWAEMVDLEIVLID